MEEEDSEKIEVPPSTLITPSSWTDKEGAVALKFEERKGFQRLRCKYRRDPQHTLPLMEKFPYMHAAYQY